MKNLKVAVAGTVSVLALLTGAPALAQANSDTQATVATGGLEDIVVTARRTGENLQVTPVAVTALSGDMLDRMNIQDVNSVPQFTPNLSIAQQSGSSTAASIYIRGIGNQEPSAVSEQGVGVYLDGVYVARSAGAIFDLVDLERIEVLRGPQGTLFGRNSVGGAIQLVSKKPAKNFGVEVKGGYGSDNEWFTRGRIDTGEFGPFSASIAYMHKQRDGYVDNVYTPSKRDPGASNGDAIYASLHGDFGALTADYSFDWNDRRNVSAFFQTVAASPDALAYYSQSAGLGGAPFQYSTDRLDQVRQDGFIDRSGKLRYDSRAKIQGHSLTFAYEALPEMTLKSITGYRKFFQDTILPLGGNGGLLGVVLDPVTFAPSIQPVNPYNGNNAPQRQSQFSQEFQALGTTGDFNYVGGAYYFHEKASEQNRQALTFVLPGGLAGLNLTPVQAFSGTTESYALFGQVGWRPASLDEKFELTGGLRYTWDRKTIRIGGDVQPEVTGHADFTNLSWLGSANYRFTPDTMGYVRVSSGYRSGGINPRTNIINTFKPEKVLSYEAGFKAEMLDRRLRTNLAVFYTDYKDVQIQQFASGSSGATSLIVNAGKVVYKGVELEVTALPVDGLTLEGSLGYTDPEYKTFLYRDPLSNTVIDVADEARMPQTAKFNAHAGAQYSVPVSVGMLMARVDYSYRSTIYWFALDRVNPFNREIRSRPDHNVRARLSLADVSLGSAKAEFSVWGDNLTDDVNTDFGIDFGGLGFGGASFKRPRTFGVDAKFRY